MLYLERTLLSLKVLLFAKYKCTSQPICPSRTAFTIEAKAIFEMQKIYARFL